jgi:NTP pyrophosphatase (non-canonical NTP hydrolase)
MQTEVIQATMKDFWTARDVPQTARQLICGMVSEAAEAALLFRFNDNPDPHKLGLETLDVIIAALGILEALGIDIQPLFEEKLADINKRYPLSEFHDCEADYMRLHGGY